jgi:hypothetical protein
MATIIDIEEYAGSGRAIPADPDNHYRVRVNNKIVVLEKRIIAAKEILSAAGFNPNNSLLLAHYKNTQGAPQKIDNEQKVDLTQGIVRFTQMMVQAVNGKRL